MNAAPAARGLVGFLENPQFQDDYDSGKFTRTMQVTNHRTKVQVSEDLWSSIFEFQSGKSTGHLSYVFPKPWGIPQLPASTIVRTRRETHTTDCADASGHDVPLVEDVVRDAEGQLLLWVVQSAPLTHDGSLQPTRA